MKKNLVIYISGKITGEPNYLEKFRRAAEDVARTGHIPLNPAVLPTGMEPQDYMRICFAMLDSADAVYLLPDWVDSSGANIERDLCAYTGKPIIETLEELRRYDD